jgi:hypothetical protein
MYWLLNNLITRTVDMRTSFREANRLCGPLLPRGVPLLWKIVPFRYHQNMLDLESSMKTV